MPRRDLNAVRGLTLLKNKLTFGCSLSEAKFKLVQVVGLVGGLVGGGLTKNITTSVPNWGLGLD